MNNLFDLPISFTTPNGVSFTFTMEPKNPATDLKNCTLKISGDVTLEEQKSLIAWDYITFASTYNCDKGVPDFKIDGKTSSKQILGIFPRSVSFTVIRYYYYLCEETSTSIFINTNKVLKAHMIVNFDKIIDIQVG